VTPEFKKRERFRFCKVKTCRKIFRVGRSGSYCDDCMRARAEARQKAKKDRRRDLKYPKGFSKARKQLEMVDRQCVVCLINQEDHKKKYGDELPMHHIILAKVAQEFGNPHAPENLAAVCVTDHAQLKSADEALLRGDWLEWVAANRRAGLPDMFMKRALEFFAIGWGRLPL
jgi:hypothetical protein